MTSDDSPPLLQIVDWDFVFEKTKSRYVDKCSWVCVPAKQDSVGLMHVLSEPDGAAIYGCWILLVQRCVKQPTPRAGWLTENGKPDGRRFTLSTLAHMFRRPRDEISRLFQVITSRDVGWVAVAEGNLRAFGIPDQADVLTLLNASLDDQQDSIVSGVHPTVPPQWQQDGPRSEENANATAVAARCQRSAPIREGKGKEEKEKGKSLSLESMVEENTGATAVAARCHELIQCAEAKRLFGQLSIDGFGESLHETQWPSDMEHLLDQALPLRRENWELINWFYRLPADHEIFKVTRRRQSLRTLVENLRSEQQKIRSARKAIGLNGLNAESEKPIASDGWTSARKQAFVEKFGDSRPFPKKFSDLGASTCRQLDAMIEHLSEAEITAAKKLYGADVPLPDKKNQLAPSVLAEIREKVREE